MRREVMWGGRRLISMLGYGIYNVSTLRAEQGKTRKHGRT